MAFPPFPWRFLRHRRIFNSMHEYGVAVEIAERAAAAAGGRRLSRVTIRIGALSGVFAESLAMYCDLLFREQQPNAVEIVAANVPARFRCACGAEYSPQKLFDPCPSCGGADRVVIDGKECLLESIEVDGEG
ncbi:MAG: hydrogenase maturation nickel metallochaperone HypA [Chitinispirillaceae bacterium]|nr:hydrogenase maturation nickel metallochaperone HypA [Chitinispirillaceae bacterium]